EDLQGHVYYHYPVTDFLPGQSPTSGGGGLMVFHHVADLFEFSGRSCEWCGYRYEKWRGPEYVCRFLYRGSEVHRKGFGELDDGRKWGPDVPRVTRRWKTPAWLMSELPPRP